MTENRTRPKNPIIIIPARLASTRLPGKPLALIHGEAMIVHVWRRAVQCGLGPVVVACDGPEIAEAIHKVGGQAVITRPDHPSGSDRIWEALHQQNNHQNYDSIINVQGDLPLIDPEAIMLAYRLLEDPSVDIATLAVPIDNEADRQASQVVKAVLDIDEHKKHGRAYYFSRCTVPWGEGVHYHHVGLYAYRRDALKQYVATKPSPLELREKLEQLRALSLGLRIEVGIINSVPLGVDTAEDLEKAKTLMRKKLK